ncbi:MAG: FAD-dependent oxidoreductase, partial [Acidobacteriota bacterium]
HNGLVAAGYLARAGFSVLVVERRPIVGGACVTEEIFRGFHFSTTSYVCSLLRPEIIQDLRLKDHGFELLPCTTGFTLFPDGRYLLLGRGEREDAEQIAPYSQKDAQRYPEFNAALARLADFLRPTLALTPPDPSSPGLGGILDLLKLGNRFRKISRADQALLLKMMTMSAADLLDEWFESPELKASLAATGTIGIWGSPRTPGTAFVLLHYQLGEAGGSPGSWGFVRGGMGGITRAMAQAVRAFGGEIRVDAPVERILSDGDAATGVVLEGGEEIAARCVLSNADPKRTFLQLVERSHLPADFVRAIENYRCNGNSAKVNLALSERPDFTALPGDGVHLQGGIQVAGAHPDYLEEAFADCRSGRPSRKPYLDIVIPSTVDDTLCPPGTHIVSVSIKFIPFELAEGDWSSRKEELGDLAVDTLSEYAPNVRRAVLHRQVLTPRCFERIYGLTGGNICHGDMAADQLFAMRPLLGWAQYRTPLRNLYLCGSGTHPGGGVMGAPGRNAAREVCRDLRRGLSHLRPRARGAAGIASLLAAFLLLGGSVSWAEAGQSEPETTEQTRQTEADEPAELEQQEAGGSFQFAAPAERGNPNVEAFRKRAEELIFDRNYDSRASAHYMIETDDPRFNVSEATMLLESFRGFFEGFWSGRVELQPYEEKFQIFLFYSRYKYKQLLDVAPDSDVSSVGHYQPYFNLVAVHTDTAGLGNLPDVLVHEAAHQLIQMMLYGDRPQTSLWMAEGLAAYFGHMLRDDSGEFHPTRIGNKGTIVFREVPREGSGLGKPRLREYRRKLRGGDAKPISTVISLTDPAEFYGPDIAEHYRASWLLVHYLLHSDGGSRADGFASYLEHNIQAQADDGVFYRDIGMSREDLDSEFHEYVRRFKGR